MTINGPGSTLLKVSGVGTTAIFKLDDGAGVHSMKVAIGKLTLLRGNAAYGGAIFNNNDDVDLRQCTLSDNVSIQQGGAYFANDGRLTVEDCEFLRNRSKQSTGGAIHMQTGSLTVLRTNFNANQSESGGGAITMNNGTDVTVRRCTITNNFSNGSVSVGGGLALGSSGPLLIVKSTITGNKAAAGGGLGLSGSGATYINQCTIAGNIAAGNGSFGDGGGVRLATAGAKVITNSTISGNGASTTGGGIMARSGAALTLRSCTVSGNFAASFGGGLCVDSFASTQTVELSTIVKNQSADSGGGIFAGRPISLFGTIVARNSAASGGQDLRGGASAVISAAFCLIQNADPAFATILETAPGSNIIGLNPKIGALKMNGGPTRTHALLSGSPALNKGANTVPAEVFDQRGPTFKRIKGGRIDIGAFEL